MDELLTVKEVAARLKVNPQTVRRWIRAGRLPAQKYGPRVWLVREADVSPHQAALRDVGAPEVVREEATRAGASWPESPGRPSLQEILDENRWELETEGWQLGELRPPTPEELARRRAVFDEIRKLRSRFAGRGPSLQELLDELRQEDEGED